MICIPITANTHEEALSQIERSCARADVLELRIDLIEDGDLRILIEKCRLCPVPIKILVTNRRKKSSPEEDISGERERIALLEEAIRRGVDYVDIEVDTPETLLQEVLSTAGAHGNRTKVIMSHHDFNGTSSLESLKAIYGRCLRPGVDIVKIVTFANNQEDNLAVLSLIPYSLKKNQEIIAFCMGKQGRTSRIAAPMLGSYLGFASLDRGAASAPGQLTIDEMEQVLKIAAGDSIERSLSAPSDMQIFGLFGNPVKQSLSPLMHDAALRVMKIEGKYLPFCVHDIASAVQGIRGMGLRGISVTIPFKVSIMEYLDEVDEDAAAIGAVNTVVNQNGRLTGFNTDWIGLVQSLKGAMDINGKVIAILGAGGTARAAVFGIRREGGIPIIVNRSLERGKAMAHELGCPFYLLDEINRVAADCLINTTPVGMMPDVEKSPVDKKNLGNYRCVMDVIYNPLKTKLVKDAEDAGCVVIGGIDMFVHQGAEQIKLWTGQEPPRECMKQVVMERLLYGN
jgi:shikimate dehydrogenase/3-dehydroquinate dehydratase type I